MKRLRITGILEYDDEEMHSGDRDPEAREWFESEVLRGTHLILHDNGELGDYVGDFTVESAGEEAGERDDTAELVGVLQELRARFHVAGRRPEECYEMSLIDEALARVKGGERS